MNAHHPHPVPLRRLLALSLGAVLAATGLPATAAEPSEPGKTVVAEPMPAVPVLPAFNQWIATFVQAPAPRPAGTIQTVPLTLSAAPAEQGYQPQPVILGLPELPLLGGAAAPAGRAWAPTLNYQGLHMALLVGRADGGVRELRPLSGPLRAGEPFKIRLTATFDGVVDIDQVIGDAWYGKRTGQVYPAPGTSVQLKAGQTVELPLGANEYFLPSRAANERLLVSVRHAKALAEARSEQPAYRLDGRNGSSYVQLQPRGTFPAIEQLVALTR